MYTCICMYSCIYTHMHTHVHVHIYVCVCVCVYVYIYMYVYIGIAESVTIWHSMKHKDRCVPSRPSLPPFLLPSSLDILPPLMSLRPSFLPSFCRYFLPSSLPPFIP